MGAEQSSSRKDGGVHDQGLMKRDYYEVLEIERQASDEEIKKAYRRKALDLHPDRNYGDVDNATIKFAEVQSAYEILSDPQERAWYDSHRESILRGDGAGDGDDKHYEDGVRHTSTNDIVGLMGRFNAMVPFTDAPNGFYGILAGTFASLAEEELLACDVEGVEAVDYPQFGNKDDRYEDVVRQFYRVWIHFSTKKSFSWMDRYRASDAPHRATRRLIERENKKFRDEGIRDFNDAIRALVAFVRRRDPRYIPSSQTEADRQQFLRDAAAAQAARSKAANQAKLNKHLIADWARNDEPEEAASSESEEVEVEHIECVVCGKTFKSEKQYETHEKSKKHQKAVQQLQREMRKENKRLKLNDEGNNSPSIPAEEEFANLNLQLDDMEVTTETTFHEQFDDPKNLRRDVPDHSVKEPDRAITSSPECSDIGDEYCSREELQKRLSCCNQQADNSTATSVATDEAGGAPRAGLGKAKAKRAKRAARQEAEIVAGPEPKCAACNESFPSKSKLFDHLKAQPKHAQRVPMAGNGKNRKF